MMIGGNKMKLIIDKLVEQVIAKNSHVCVGLDPHLQHLPEFLLDKYLKEYSQPEKAISQAILEFNKNIIKQIADIAVAVKPQIAFYELLGPAGLKTLQATIKYAQKTAITGDS